MDEYMTIKNRIKNKRNSLVFNNKKKKSNPNQSKYISQLFTRTLLSVILVLAFAIYINISDENLIRFNHSFFKENLKFTEINNLYAKYFGDILPDKVAKTTPVFDSKETLTDKITPYLDHSYLLTLSTNAFNYLESGIIVFIGEKENLGKTVIVQGIDGTDIWYSNLENFNGTIYDYVEKNTIIGQFKENKPILTFIEDGKNIGYENYLS